MGTLALDYNILQKQPMAHTHLRNPTDPFDIDAVNTWQKLDLSTGNPQIIGRGGWVWDAVNKWFKWDEGGVIEAATGLIPDQLFTGDAQILVTSAISGLIDIDLGFVLNGDTVNPVLITRTTFSNQAKISSYGANDVFIDETDFGGVDERIHPDDSVDIYIRCLTDTPTVQINGFNTIIKGR